MDASKWWADWQNADHALKFDFRSAVPERILVRDLESFNDVLLLKQSVDANHGKLLLEVGCATGDFYRYTRIKYPRISYCGIDVSRTAVDRARNKYPAGKFERVDPDWDADAISRICGRRPDIVFSKDVVHHQVNPLEFISRLLKLPAETLIFRTRTRDQGPTESDPEKSCQFHYDGWMPYIVVNLDELIGHVRKLMPKAEIEVWRNHMVLGGQYGRFLPKDCYVASTGTAETAVRVAVSSNSGKLSISDRRDANPKYSVLETLMLGIRKVTSRQRLG